MAAVQAMMQQQSVQQTTKSDESNRKATKTTKATKHSLVSDNNCCRFQHNFLRGEGESFAAKGRTIWERGDQPVGVDSYGVGFTAVDFCRLYLHYPGIRLFLEKMKDRDNWHPWDYGMQPPEQLLGGPSPFISPSEVVHLEDVSDEVRCLLMNVFLQNNRLEHLYEVMAYHPQYLSVFLKTQQFILQEDGPLPFHFRHYIAIMAAARHRCSNLIRIHSREFLLQGGSEAWLRGLRYAPVKLQKLNEVNKILAHQPWRITKDHLERLQRGTDSLSMSEVMQAIVLLTHFHSVSSFVFGSGINSRADHSSLDHRVFEMCECDAECFDDHGKFLRTNGNRSCAFHTDSGAEVENLVERMTKLTQESLTEEEMKKRFEKIEIQNAELSSKAALKSSPSQQDLLRFVDDSTFGYADFSSCKRACGASTFRAQDYSWDDHGYSLSSRLYPDVGEILDEKFKIAQNLTYDTMGDHADVDTSSFRRAIWNYVHSLYGIRHDDYDYSVVDQLLGRNLKSYVKTVACFPERVNRQDYDTVMTGFRHSEKVHVNLMTLEARLQAELLYSLRAIGRHMA